MARSVSARELIGKRIIGFDPGTSVAGSGVSKRTMHDPRIYLDDGSVLLFVTEEHPEDGEYGVFAFRTKPKGRAGAR